jgi:hypothetical protein
MIWHEMRWDGLGWGIGCDVVTLYTQREGGGRRPIYGQQEVSAKPNKAM